MNVLKIEPLYEAYRPWANSVIKEWWSSTRIVTRGKIHNADELPGFVAVRDGFPVGLIIYEIDDRGCEVVCLNSVREGIGVGTALMDKVRKEALKADCGRMWLITTNDNLKAVRYYQKRGFRLAAFHKNAIEESRKLKPEIPKIGFDGIPIKDEIEMEFVL